MWPERRQRHLERLRRTAVKALSASFQAENDDQILLEVTDYSPLFALFVLFAIRYSLVAVRCSLFANRDYSLFGFSRHPETDIT